MEVLLYLLYWIICACFGEVSAGVVLVALFVGPIAVVVFVGLRNRLRFPGATAEAGAHLDDAAIIELAHKAEQPLVAFECVYDGAGQRVAVFSRTANRLHSPRYCWIASDSKELVRARVSAAGIRTATADSEACGVWYVVRTDDHEAPIVWASHVENGCALIEDQGHWVIRVGWRRRAIEKSAIVAIEAWASGTWLRHEVRLHVQTPTGVQVVEVAHKLAWRAIADGFYDGLEFMGDSCWALGLGCQLANRLGLPLLCTGELGEHKD